MLLHPKKTKFKSGFGRKRMKYINNPILKSSLKCFGIISYETGKINNKQIFKVKIINETSEVENEYKNEVSSLTKDTSND